MLRPFVVAALRLARRAAHHEGAAGDREHLELHVGPRDVSTYGFIDPAGRGGLLGRRGLRRRVIPPASDPEGGGQADRVREAAHVWYAPEGSRLRAKTAGCRSATRGVIMGATFAAWLLVLVGAVRRARAGSGSGRAADAFRVRRDAHGQPVSSCFILHRRSHRQTRLPGGLRSHRGPQQGPERLRPRERALAAVAVGRQGPGARSAPTCSTCSSDRSGCHERSDGAFDVTIAPVGRLWRRARRDRKLPDPRLLAEARTLVGSDKMVLDPAARTVQLSEPGHEARRRRDRQGLCGPGGARRAEVDGDSPRPGGRGGRHRRRRPAPGCRGLEDRHRAAGSPTCVPAADVAR